MKTIENHAIPFEDYVESIAQENLTDFEYEMEYQGGTLHDKCLYLSNKVGNIMPLYEINK